MVSTDGDRGWRSYSSFGLFRDDGETNDRINYGKSRRFQLSFVVVALALLIVTGVFIVLQVTRSTKETVTKSKRFVRYDEIESTSKKPRTDVDIIPESKTHPNHRYEQPQSRDQIMERIMKNIYNEWPPEGEPKTRNNIRDIIRRIETREKLRKEAEMRNSRGMATPILFKGVYVKKGVPEEVPENDSDVEYFKEINEMLQGEKSEEKRVRSYRGSPFQLKNQVARLGGTETVSYISPNPEQSLMNEPERRQLNTFQQLERITTIGASRIPIMRKHSAYADGRDETKRKASEEGRRGEKKPITVMLDVYPIIKSEEEVSETGGRNVAYAILPGRVGGGRPGLAKNARMILKLNLFPKNSRDGRQIDESSNQLNRRTFGWFKKKEEGHVCQLVRHNPQWKPVTAEWKDEHGDWIKANYLTLKYWDRKFT